MKSILLFLLLFTTAALRAQPPALAWARSVGGMNADYAAAVGTDPTGASYYTGVFRGTVDFDPGPGTTALTAPGTTSATFVLKLDSAGAFVWAKAVTSTTSATPFDMAVDGTGNVIIGGGFTGTADFDPDPTATVSHSSIVTQLFILKLTTTGTFAWVATMGGSLARAQGVAVDAAGDVYAAGDFQNTLDFDPGPGTANLTAAGFNDIFVCKLSAAGAYQWAGRMGGGSADFGTSVAVDAGSVYVGGYFAGTADMDPGAGTSNLTASANNGCVVKLTAAGTFVWAAALGGSGTALVGDLAPIAGDVLAAGNFLGTADFDPGAGSTMLASGSSSGYNGYVARLSGAGNFVWARHMASTSGSSGAGGLAVDGAGDIFCAGSFGGTADLDPGSGTTNATAAGTTDGYLCKLSGSGALLWAGAFGGSGGSNAAADVALDAAGQPCVASQFVGVCDADLGTGSADLSSAGNTDVFMAKYRAGADGTASVGHGQADGRAAIVLSPNPASTHVVLQSGMRMQRARLCLLDATGRAVRVWSGVDGHVFTMSLDGLPAGVYVLEAATGAGFTHTRVVKK